MMGNMFKEVFDVKVNVLIMVGSWVLLFNFAVLAYHYAFFKKNRILP